MDGVLLLNKKSGFTSFDSLAAVKKTFSTRKAGHSGTLDKFATGLLVVLVGQAVKLNFLFENFDKDYTGTILFGKETDTLDPEGEVIASGPIPSREQVESALNSFRGEILQAPPAYSALHINGRRAHELAREGKAPEMKKRPAFIHELEIISWAPPQAVIHAKVSSGTYIRSLARDIAIAASSRGHLGALERNTVGPFRLAEAVTESSDFEKALLPLRPELFKTLSIPCFFLNEREADDFIHGRPIDKLINKFNSVEGKTDTAVFYRENAAKRESAANSGNECLPLGILVRKNEKWSYGHVYANN